MAFIAGIPQSILDNNPFHVFASVGWRGQTGIRAGAAVFSNMDDGLRAGALTAIRSWQHRTPCPMASWLILSPFPQRPITAKSIEVICAGMGITLSRIDTEDLQLNKVERLVSLLAGAIKADYGIAPVGLSHHALWFPFAAIQMAAHSALSELA